MLIVIWELMVPNSVAPSGLGGWWGAFNPKLAHGASGMWTFQGFWSLLIFVLGVCLDLPPPAL
jgi:hypothetical protein